MNICKTPKLIEFLTDRYVPQPRRTPVRGLNIVRTALQSDNFINFPKICIGFLPPETNIQIILSHFSPKCNIFDIFYSNFHFLYENLPLRAAVYILFFVIFKILDNLSVNALAADYKRNCRGAAYMRLRAYSSLRLVKRHSFRAA